LVHRIFNARNLGRRSTSRPTGTAAGHDPKGLACAAQRDEGDTKTIQETVAEAGERITSIVADTDNDAVAKQVSAEGPREVVTDKGYHSRAVVSEMAEWGVRTYCSEPDRGRQRWPDQRTEQRAVYANRRRIGGERGRQLLRQRGEKLERWNQHLYDRSQKAVFASFVILNYLCCILGLILLGTANVKKITFR
jgi:hypothetical protein